MTAQLAYPTVAQFDGLAVEDPANPGTPVPMTATIPLESDLKWEDKPAYASDKGKRGVMGDDSHGEIQGVIYSDLSGMGGAVFMDTIGYLLANILGDVVDTGTAAPFQHQVSLLNPTAGAPTAQPPTLSWTHYDGVTPTVGARVFPYVCLSQLVIEWDNATGLLMWSGKGEGWPSAPAVSRPVAAPSSLKPKPSWISKFAVGGTVTGNSVANLEKMKLTIDRELEQEYMGNGQQNSLLIGRGGLKAGIEATFLAQDLTYYNDNINNTQPQVQAVFSTGSAGTLESLQLDMQQVAFEKTVPNGSKKMFRWDVNGPCVFNTTNVGASGGRGPLQATLKNAVTTGTYT